MDFTEFNRDAWDNIAKSKRWFDPVDQESIERARQGDWSIRLTGSKPIPQNWVGNVAGKDVLCLAGGGGHQGPVLAAAGANVTVLDISDAQLEIDREVATANGLKLSTIVSDMGKMDALDGDSFDLIMNPCSVNFCKDVLPIWQEAYRVLRVGGELLAGMIQPVNYLFDAVSMDNGKFVVRHKIPYSDWDLPEPERSETIGPERPIDFGHTLSDLIGGQLRAGFLLVDLIEDRWGGDDPLSEFIATFVATRARKLSI